MSIFRKTIKYSKPSTEIDNKIESLNRGIEKIKSTLPESNFSDEKIEEILNENFVDVQNWREIFDEETVSNCDQQINEIRERHNDLVNVQGSIEYVKNKEVKEIFNELYQGEVEKVVETYISKYSNQIVDLREDLFHEVKKKPNVNIKVLEDKINFLTLKYNELSEGLLNEPNTEIESSITFEQLKNHYQLLVGRLQEQLATVGGGGEVRLQYLDDIVGIATNAAAFDGKFLRYNHSLKKFEFVDVSGGGGGGISLTDFSVTTNSVGTAALSYDNLNGSFNYTPPDLSNFLTSASLVGYATEGYVDNAVAGIGTTSGSGSSFSGDYNDLTNKPTIPNVGSGSLIIKSYGQESTASGLFNANASSNVQIILPQIRYSDLSGVPTIPTNNNELTNGAGYITTSFTDTSQLTNGAGFITGVSTFSGDYNDLTNVPTIPTNNNELTNGAGYITTSFTDTSQLTNGAGFITNNVTGDLNVSGNISIAGTLTYEDVTNIDSVGLITARSGIRVTGDVIEAPAGQNKIPFLYSDLGSLPSASTYHGMFAHVHSEGKGYFAHAGNWLELVNRDTNGNVSISGTITASEFSGSIAASNLTGALPAIDGSALTGIVASGTGIVVQEEGVNVGTAGTINFIGTGVTATFSNGIASIEISNTTNTNANANTIPTYTSEWTLGANGSNHYTFSGPGLTGAENDPDIYLVRGQQYKFTNNMGAHPFRIQSTSNGSAGSEYNDGITNNNVSNGTLTWNVQFDAPTILYYQCTAHPSMGGKIIILDESSDRVYADVSSFPSVSTKKGDFAYADDTGTMYYSNGSSWTSQRIVTTNSTSSSDFATLLGNTQLTYSINVLDYTGGTQSFNNARKIIRLEDSSGTTDQIVLVAGDGLSISDSGDEIELINDVANSTYTISAGSTSGNADSKLILTDNAGVTDEITFAGADGLTVEYTDANTLTFRAPSSGSGGSFTSEDAQDATAQLFANGNHTGITFVYNDANNSIGASVVGGGGGGSGTTYDLSGRNTTSNNAFIDLVPSSGTTDSIELAGNNGTTVSWDANNNRITFDSDTQVQSDWNATSGIGSILNKPTIPPAYTLPTASSTTLGGIKVGANLSIDASTGTLSANPGSYTLPTASSTTLGGIKIGSGLSVDGNGVVNATGGSSVPQIQDLSGTTSSIADNISAELDITGYKAYSLFKITTDAEAWVRVYVDDASRDADTTRSEGEDPSPGSGVVAEVRTSGAESILISPGIMGFNNDSPTRTNTIYLSVTNRSGSTTTITVTLTALQIGE